jgi:hypothetical protein
MRAIGGLLLFLLLAGCVTGDFGRVKPSLVSDDTHAWVGREAAREAGYRPSTFVLTDDERQLRDLAYPLIEPPYNRHLWDKLLFEYGIAPTSGPVWPHFDEVAYRSQLVDRPFRSSAARYAQLIDDIRNDDERLASFVPVARRVLDMDGKRKQSLAYVSSVNESERMNARQRITENALIINWVRHALHQRAVGYRQALERVVVETPSSAAADAEHALNLLRQKIATAQLG